MTMKHYEQWQLATILAVLLLQSSQAFTPSFPTSSTRVIRFSTETDIAVAADPFASYRQDGSQGLVYRDTIVGTGDAAQKGQVVTVAYTGRLLSTGAQFDQGSGFGFRLGEGKVIPGW
jgi:FKBP-type peptidyl-prolyl cis-trans isomerase